MPGLRRGHGDPRDRRRRRARDALTRVRRGRHDATVTLARVIVELAVPLTSSLVDDLLAAFSAPRTATPDPRVIYRPIGTGARD